MAGINVPSDLGVLFNSKALDGIDILSFGVQECGIFKTREWEKHIKKIVCYYGFVEITTIKMFQMFLIIFIRKDLEQFVDKVESYCKPMGVANVIGNKGGMIIAFKLMEYQFVFVNCHLAPKSYKTIERNLMAKNLIKTLRIGEKFCEFDCSSDFLFWQGDLNYRIDYDYNLTIYEINNNNLKFLLTKDQLIKQRQRNEIFYDFKEGEINFKPTYRRIKGQDKYSNKANQSPSWCDRIMVRTDKKFDINFYDSIPEVNER